MIWPGAMQHGKLGAGAYQASNLGGLHNRPSSPRIFPCTKCSAMAGTEVYWSGRQDLNLRPPHSKCGTLTQTELRPENLDGRLLDWHQVRSLTGGHSALSLDVSKLDLSRD